MGFFMRSCYVLGGSEEFPTGTTDALRRSRSETLLTKCAQCLIDCGCGWQLDTTKSTSLTDYTDIPSLQTTPKYMPGLFFINTISGCKLFMSYFGTASWSYGIKNFNASNLAPFSTNRHTGLCISIIPAGSESVFGDPTQNSFIPSDATRICGSFYSSLNSSGGGSSAAYSPENGTYYKYYILATSTAVAVAASHGSSIPGLPNAPIYATGRILGNLAHASDDASNANYATVMLRKRSSNYDGDGEVFTTGMSTFVGGGNYTYSVGYNNEGSGSNIGSIYCTAAIARSNGTWINGSSSTAPVRNVIHYTANPYLVNTCVSSSSIAAWSPIAVASIAADLATYGVIPGNGFKGFLDTDLFRCAGAGTQGTTFDNDKLYYCETNKYLVIGWDPSNNS